MLDENTVALPKDEVDRLFDAIQQVKERGIEIIYTTHKLEEVFRITDQVTVLRDGSWVGTYPVQDLNKHRLVKDLIRTFKINPPDPDRLFRSLSDGNQQKAILAKWLMLKPDLLICDKPVRSVDVGSKTEIYNLIEQATQESTAVLLMNSEYADLEHMCDKVLVLRSGRIVAELAGEQLTEQRNVELLYLQDEEITK